MGNAHILRGEPPGAPGQIDELRTRMNGYRLRVRMLESLLCAKEIELTAWRKGVDPKIARAALISGMEVDSDGSIAGAEEALSRHIQGLRK